MHVTSAVFATVRTALDTHHSNAYRLISETETALWQMHHLPGAGHGVAWKEAHAKVLKTLGRAYALILHDENAVAGAVEKADDEFRNARLARTNATPLPAPSEK